MLVLPFALESWSWSWLLTSFGRASGDMILMIIDLYSGIVIANIAKSVYVYDRLCTMCTWLDLDLDFGYVLCWILTCLKPRFFRIEVVIVVDILF